MPTFQSIKSDDSTLSDMVDKLNTLANSVKTEINDELSKTTTKLQDNIGNIFPNHKIDIQPQAGKFDVDKILAAGTFIRVADSPEAPARARLLQKVEPLYN